MGDVHQHEFGGAPCVEDHEVEKSVLVTLELLESIVSPDKCWFDHNGGCQEHGYIFLRQGELCPQYELQQIIERANAS